MAAKKKINLSKYFKDCHGVSACIFPDGIMFRSSKNVVIDKESDTKMNVQVIGIVRKDIRFDFFNPENDAETAITQSVFPYIVDCVGCDHTYESICSIDMVHHLTNSKANLFRRTGIRCEAIHFRTEQGGLVRSEHLHNILKNDGSSEVYGADTILGARIQVGHWQQQSLVGAMESELRSYYGKTVCLFDVVASEI